MKNVVLFFMTIFSTFSLAATTLIVHVKAGARAEIIRSLLSEAPAGEEEKNPLKHLNLVCKLDREKNGRSFTGTNCNSGKREFSGELSSVLFVLSPENMKYELAAGHITFSVTLDLDSSGWKISYP